MCSRETPDLHDRPALSTGIFNLSMIFLLFTLATTFLTEKSGSIKYSGIASEYQKLG